MLSAIHREAGFVVSLFFSPLSAFAAATKIFPYASYYYF